MKHVKNIILHSKFSSQRLYPNGLFYATEHISTGFKKLLKSHENAYYTT